MSKARSASLLQRSLVAIKVEAVAELGVKPGPSVRTDLGPSRAPVCSGVSTM